TVLGHARGAFSGRDRARAGHSRLVRRRTRPRGNGRPPARTGCRDQGSSRYRLAARLVRLVDERLRSRPASRRPVKPEGIPADLLGVKPRLALMVLVTAIAVAVGVGNSQANVTNASVTLDIGSSSFEYVTGTTLYYAQTASTS